MKMIRRIASVFCGVFGVMLAIILVVAVVLANNYSAMISTVLAQSTTEISNSSDIMYYESSYDSDEERVNAAEELCLELVEEGMVLLTNEDQALPLAQGARVSLLGQNSVDLVYGGAGAGSVDSSRAGTLKDSLEAAGFEVNDVLWDFYENGAGADYRKETPNVVGMGNMAVHEVPLSEYTDAEFASMEEYNDAAIVTIGRTGSESIDLPEEYLNLTDDEIDLLQMANERFDTVIVILNITNALNMDCFEGVEPDAMLWVGALGQTGVYAIGEALNGTVNPSGHMVDTYAYEASSAPSTENFGDYTITNSEVEYGTTYMVYAEGIYIGYRYYETRYEDVVLSQGNAGDYDYTETVRFPFGYGLSYTEFAWSDYTVEETEDTYEVSVTVTNTGCVAGKDVVEIYMQSPYTEYDIENGIEKSAVELVGFAKTGEIAPGGSETVTVSVDKESMKTYDANGAGTYIVDAGDYYFTAGKDAHDAINNILAAKGYTTADGMDTEGNAAMTSLVSVAEIDTVTYATSAETGNVIENQLENVDINYYDEDFTYLSRRDWTGTYPVTYADGSWEAPEAVLDDLVILEPEEDEDAVEPAFETVGETELTLADLIGADYDDPRWETLLDQASFEELYDLIRHAGYSSYAVDSISAPGVVHRDGPAGISSTLAGGDFICTAYPPEVVIASSWNVDLAHNFGIMVGEDSIAGGVAVWYAPAMNIHRNARSGRNFEYYSEDSFLSGTLAAAEVAGAQSKGTIVTIKHFALNDQETNRAGGSIFANEQSAREIYLKAFEMAVTDGGAIGIMSSMNRIGTTWIGAHVGIMTNILRDEWDYEGFVITDQTSFPFFNYCDIISGLAAGNDLWLNTGDNMWQLSDEDYNATVKNNVRQAAHRYLYAVANSNAMNGIDSDTVVMNVRADWEKFVPVVCIVVILICIGFFVAARCLWKDLRKKRTGGPGK